MQVKYCFYNSTGQKPPNETHQLNNLGIINIIKTVVDVCMPKLENF